MGEYRCVKGKSRKKTGLHPSEMKIVQLFYCARRLQKADPLDQIIRFPGRVTNRFVPFFLTPRKFRPPLEYAQPQRNQKIREKYSMIKFLYSYTVSRFVRWEDLE